MTTASKPKPGYQGTNYRPLITQLYKEGKVEREVLRILHEKGHKEFHLENVEIAFSYLDYEIGEEVGREDRKPNIEFLRRFLSGDQGGRDCD